MIPKEGQRWHHQNGIKRMVVQIIKKGNYYNNPIIQCLFIEGGVKARNVGEEWEAVELYPSGDSDLNRWKYLPNQDQA